MASMIDVFNSSISNALNKYGDFYKAWIGDMDYTPEVTIIDSEDINCGAMCNELEFARLQTQEVAESFTVDGAETDLLDAFVETFIELPRRGSLETDAMYRERFKAILTEKTNYRRQTRWAIIDAITEFGILESSIQVIEFFDTYNNYFQIRFTATYPPDPTYLLFLDNDVNTNGFLDQYYLGGLGIGYLEAFLSAIVRRIKAAGVDFDIIMIARGTLTKTADAEVA